MDDFLGKTNNCMNFIKIPDCFHGKEYQNWLTVLMFKFNAVPLGLYRIDNSGNRYVYINPTPCTKLDKNDFSYVLKDFLK